MQGRALLAACLLAAAAVAGCTAADDEHEPHTCPDGTVLDPEGFEGHDDEGFDIAAHCPSPSPTPSPTSSPTLSPSPSAGPNRAPVPTLSASTAGGALPLEVSFTMDATDPDGDALEWAFDADDDGEAEAEGTGDELPFEFTFNYTEEGTYEATFYVADEDELDYATVDINVTASDNPAGQVAQAEWAAGGQWCAAPLPQAEAGLPVSGVLYGEIALDPASPGWAFNGTFAVDETHVFGAVAFYDEAGAFIEQAVTDVGGLEVAGTVPAGAVFALVYTCGSPMGSLDYAAAPA